MEPMQLSHKDLVFYNMIENDRLNTYLTLKDYDWMNYELRADFHVKDSGKYEVLFEYMGFSTCFMTVDINGFGKYRYIFDHTIFAKHIKKFMKAHMKNWNQKYAFNGEELFLDFYNEALECGTLEKITDSDYDKFETNNEEFCF